MNAIPLENFTPGSAQWMKRMTASKIAAVLGLSPWESRYSLWHRMAGLLPAQEDTDQTRRGHYLEDAVAQWFWDQHPPFLVEPGNAWAHPDRAWQAASPDRLILNRTPGEWTGSPTALLEIKTTAFDDEWGPAGTDEIPPYYRCQVMWQLDTLGLQVGYVAVLLPRLEFREYRIDYNPAEAAELVAEARDFLDSLPGGPAEQVPNLDAHAETYRAVRRLHSDIDPVDVDVPHWLARDYCAAVDQLRRAAKAHDYWRTVMADHMQTARRALWDGKSIATRRARGDSDPYVQAAAKLPEIGDAA
jgi:putative phage-type endonuclease